MSCFRHVAAARGDKKTLDHILDLIAWSRVLETAQIIAGNRCTIAVYHSVATCENNPYIDETIFSSHMEMLRDAFHVLSAEEYLFHLAKGLRFPRKSVLVTVDDGLENNYSVIRPIMERLGLPWVCFTPTQSLDIDNRILWFPLLRGVCLYSRCPRISLLGRTWLLGDLSGRARTYREINSWLRSFSHDNHTHAALWELLDRHRPEVPDAYINAFCRLMTPNQVLSLHSSGAVEIGCHTRTHPFLPCLTDAALVPEIDGATHTLAALLNCRIRMLAYPSGYYGSREVRRVSALGIDCAFSVDKTVGINPRYEIPRVGIYSPSPSLANAKFLGISSLLRPLGVRTG